MAATAPPLPLFSRVEISGAATLAFSDGWQYAFTNAQLLLQAQNVESMAQLQAIGEQQIRNIMIDAWKASGSPWVSTFVDGIDREHEMTGWTDDWVEMFEDGMGEKVYLTWMADAAGVHSNIMMKGGVSATSPQYDDTPAHHGNFVEKAGAVEAVVGAVFQDCGGDCDVTMEVMRRFEVYWPVSGAEERQLKDHHLGLRKLDVIKR